MNHSESQVSRPSIIAFEGGSRKQDFPGFSVLQKYADMEVT